VETSSASQGALEAALFDTRRPVLVTPPKPRGDLFGRALIAWNGSAEASAAVALAMPLLAAAKEVSVFTAVEAKHKGEAEDLIAYLGWHGIAAKREAASSPSRTGGVGADLLALADATGVGLIVMGGYTRGCLRQIVFGGVTRHVFHHAALPVLMAH
jgi:nucleotide-binding universal stress UspA family protein